MRLIKTILKILIPVIFGYWLAVSQIASGTLVGDALDGVMSYLPVTSEYWDNLDWSQSMPQLSVMTEQNEPQNQPQTIPDDQGKASSQLNESQIDEQQIKNYIVELTNDLRAQQGLHTLSVNPELEIAGDIRATETMTVFSHTRPNGQDPFTVLTDSVDSPNYNYQFVGENLGMATYHRTDADMAEIIFNGWAESEGHYENMINENYTEMGVGIDYDGEYLYITQFFGTPQF